MVLLDAIVYCPEEKGVLKGPSQRIQVQLGPHRVTVLLNGMAVPGTPLPVTVGPAALHPPACLLRGLDEPTNAGLGMLTFHVHGRDAFGNVAKLGPRALQVVTEPPGAPGFTNASSGGC